MLSPGTNFVKNHESQLKNAMNPKLKMRWPLCNQTDNLKTDSKTFLFIYCNLINVVLRC